MGKISQMGKNGLSVSKMFWLDIFEIAFRCSFVNDESKKMEWEGCSVQDWVQARQLHNEMWTRLRWKSKN